LRRRAWLALPLLAGCSSYSLRAVGGHIELLSRARPVDDWLADPATPPATRAQLRLAQRLRRFAVTDLALPDNASYRRYVELPGAAVVWNVVAAPQAALELKRWCFPVMGCVSYRGYWQEEEARQVAEGLQAEGWDVYRYGVPAYSTLGYSNWLGGDPLLSSFLRGGQAELARLLFHELAHQQAYARDDSVFNESYATAVEQLGLRAWWAAHPDPVAQQQDRERERRRSVWRERALALRADLQRLYAGPGVDKRAAKAERLRAFVAEMEALAAQDAGYSGYLRLGARRQQCFAGPALHLPLAGCGLRGPVRAAQGKLAELSPRGGAAGCAAARPAQPGTALMSTIHIHREHKLGMAKARKIAWAWAEQVEEHFGMACTVYEGEDSDTIEFTRSGVKGELIVSKDAFELQAKLGLLLGALRGRIEKEIEGELDKLLAGGAPRARRKSNCCRSSGSPGHGSERLGLHSLAEPFRRPPNWLAALGYAPAELAAVV
jgi:putative polyhydroxyalkanoate system protein